jgi:hypothetical protein
MMLSACNLVPAKVVRIRQGEAWSAPPSIALDLAEARGTNPSRFRYDEDPRRERAFESIGF